MLPSDLLNIVRSDVPFEAELLSHCEKLHPTTLESIKKRVNMHIEFYDYIVNPRGDCPHYDRITNSHRFYDKKNKLFDCDCENHFNLYDMGLYEVELCINGDMVVEQYDHGCHRIPELDTKVNFNQLMVKYEDEITGEAIDHHKHILYDSVFGQTADVNDAWGLVFDIFSRNFKSES